MWRIILLDNVDPLILINKYSLKIIVLRGSTIWNILYHYHRCIMISLYNRFIIPSITINTLVLSLKKIYQLNILIIVIINYYFLYYYKILWEKKGNMRVWGRERLEILVATVKVLIQFFLLVICRLLLGLGLRQVICLCLLWIEIAITPSQLLSTHPYILNGRK